ncbi:hypothetical protein CRUP_027656 [Coryphaenoides rupestris]|nr:hypothetical protein CRUP_027656 [Coryphaenoides rupestris]
MQEAGSKPPIISITSTGKDVLKSGTHHFCYSSRTVRVWSSKPLKVTVAEDEETLQEMEGLNFWGILERLVREQSNETTIAISLFSKKTCFKIAPSEETTPYAVKVISKFDIYLFLVFLAGVLLFFFSDSLSRSQIFYYSAGMSTGMIASLVILFFILARFMPKERSVNILTWTLQLFGLLLVYAGVQIQQVALAVIVAAVCAKNVEYPLVLAQGLWRKLGFSHRIRWKGKPRRLLTEEEYQKQAEEETQKALEELRKYCNSPDISPWKTVSRIQSPKRFADFVEGLSHLRPNEVAVHAQEYGFGSSFLEEQFFDTEEEEESEDDADDNEDTKHFSRRY